MLEIAPHDQIPTYQGKMETNTSPRMSQACVVTNIRHHHSYSCLYDAYGVIKKHLPIAIESRDHYSQDLSLPADCCWVVGHRRRDLLLNHESFRQKVESKQQYKTGAGGGGLDLRLTMNHPDKELQLGSSRPTNTNRHTTWRKSRTVSEL